ncbi:DNA-binding protein [Hyphococcus sp.]|uniref:DNA-binding protein n=1 Tax=Hyphococcus sp. TaxID=2038636 RepID=UPI003CCC42DC
MEQGKRWLDTHEAAAYVNLSPSKLKSDRVSGTGFTFTKFGRSVRYDRLALDREMQARQRRSTSEEHRIAHRGIYLDD